METQQIKFKLIPSIIAVIVIALLSLITTKELLNPQPVLASNEPYYPNAVISVGDTQTRASDMFMKFDGIEGESKDNGHQEWSDILSFSQGHGSRYV